MPIVFEPAWADFRQPNRVTTTGNAMGPGTILLLAFIAVPILEIWLLITVGGLIGVLPTIALVVLTAVLGMAMIRAQGSGALRRARTAMDRGEPPIGSVVDAAFLLVAGALMLTPGFFTDTLGFLCLVPPIRRAAAAWLWTRYGDRVVMHSTGTAAGGHGRRAPGGARAPDAAGSRGPGPVIDGEFEVVTPPEPGPPRDDSPWRDVPKD